MISNFSEVEKSLKRCLKEKVSITAATVVGFLIAGTVAFGGEPTNVEFKTADNSGKSKVTVIINTDTTDIEGATNSISVADYEKLTTVGEPLAGLLTIETVDGVTTFASAVNEKGEATLGTVKATGTDKGLLTLIKTEKDYKSIISELTIEASGAEGNEGTAMEAANSGDKVTNAGTIAVKNYAVGMVAGAGATAVNDTNSEITVGGEDSSVGMSAVTEDTKSTTLTNNGKITVTKGTGISVAGAGEAKVTFGAAGEIEVESDASNIGINIAGTGTTTVTGAAITLAGAGKGINAGGNVTLENIELNFGDNATGTGIVYAGGGTDKAIKAEISTGDMAVAKGGATGIDATTSKVAESTLNIKTGSISTGNASATGIKITGGTGTDSGTSIATVTTTLGATAGTGVEVAGAKNNTINVTLQDSLTKESSNTEVSGTGVKITDAENGEVTVKINQQNLKVTGTGNLVNIGAVGGTTNIDINQNVELVGTGNLVNVGKITGTTNVNINKDINVATEGTGNIVTAGNLGEGGTLNINLNVKGNTGLNVKEENTALNLASVDKDNKASVKNTGTVTIEGKGILVAGHDTNAISLSNQGLIDLKVVDKDNEDGGNSVISTGKKVNVANYGTIKLNITSEDFLKKYNDGKEDNNKVTELEKLTIAQVRETLVALGIIASSEKNFSSVGYIKFEGGELFTTAKALTGEQTVEGLSSTLNQEDSDRAFAIAKGVEVTLNSAGENEKLENVQFSLDGTMKIGTEGTPVVIDNSNVGRQVYITGNGKLEVENDAILNYSGNISADNVVNNNNAAIENNGTLTLENGALNMVVPKAEVASLSEPAEQKNRVGILVKGDKTTNLNNYTVNADIEGELSGGSALQGTLSAKGKSRITGNVTDIKDIKVTDNGMLTFGANSKIIVSDAATSGEKTKIDLTAGKMGVEIGESGNVLMNSVGKIKFTGTYGADKSDESNKGKVVLLTNALTENTTFNLGTHDGLNDGDIIANGDIYYNITQGNGGIWNATFNKDGLIDKTGYKYMELNDMYVATQSIHDLLSADIDLRVAQLDDLYSNNIYSETVKMSLDTLKMNEDAVLSLNVRPKQGEYTAQGKFLFTNTDYDRDGVVRDYKVETKNTGLLGAMEYGLTDTSSVGFAFSGTKQDLDMKNGASADGDAFYFGLYRNDKFNNIDLTTGLGYMIDRVDAKNFTGKDKFDSTAFSGYVQGKYNYAIGENLTLSPKARLTVTRFQQDSINNGRMKQEEVKDTMADVELGVEIKKGIALETGRMNLLAGASFTTNVAGKDDDYYKVSFISRAGNEGDSTKVKGANLEKNSLKLNIGADVELTNGVFYNGGLSYEFDDEDRDSIGVTLGAGYKF
ncbi:MAG: autotransporter outer membrane beta-barrel domain-containing protein [Fusobacterium varium]|uniref:autotransporter domain-containing protein n=1 Tax=Fusobacterium varium TaxID=856 RepID=UPI00242BB857|nr:autotransporter outer membrane beta-barrel domain-containing protein [Fusobacterium varium]UYI79206.1 MAG: autotransporter outer membrane beta-barrel domain-containing protein [Fusobacterium varium]